MESIALLFVAGVLLVIGGSWIAPRIGVAAPIVLVLVGIACSFIPGQEPIEIEPEWILAIVLPPILYAAAVSVPITDFKRNIRAITALSVGLVIISAIVIGFVLTCLLPGLPLAAGVALGAVVAPPDAVAATSIGKRLGLPPRLVTVLEGEGLVNDATALVLLRSAIAALGGTVTLLNVAADFVFAVAAAIVVGLVVGLLTVWARARIEQPTLTTAISFTVPFLAFLPAEALHASGVLAVVVAGLITGYKSARHLTAQDRISERMNWRTIQLLLENGVFLVMGYQLTYIVKDVKDEQLNVWGSVSIGLVVCLILLIVRSSFMVPLLVSLRFERRRASRKLTRADALLTAHREFEPSMTSTISRRASVRSRRIQRRRVEWEMLAGEGMGWRGGAVLAWSGMRGVVTLAAAQTLPTDVPFRPQLILIAFTVAVVTLIAYGTTLPPVIRWLGVTGPGEETRRKEIQALVAEVVSAGATRLRSPDLRRADGEPFDSAYVEVILTTRARVAHNYWEQFEESSTTEGAQSAALFRILLEAEQAALLDARTSGNYSAEALELAQMVIDTDAARTSQQGTVG